MWKGYTTLSVPVQTDQALVNGLLSERGCGGCILLESQKGAQVQEDFFSEYDKRKAAYFFDREKSVRIYYVPDRFAGEAAAVVQQLQSNYHVDAALGSRAAFPYMTVLVCLFAFLALLRFAQNKAVFSLAAAPAIFYSLCNPFYAAAAAVCLELYAIYLGQRLWRRRGAAAALFNNAFIIVFSAAALLISAAAGFLRSFFFILNFAAAIALLFLYFNFQAKREKSARFVPVLIINARTAGAVGARTIKKSFFVSVEILVLFVLLFAGTSFLSSGGKGGLFFPAPTEYNERDEAFPTIEDYYADKWARLAFPYRSLNKKSPAAPQEGERVEMTHYEKTKDGIKSRTEVLFSYDAAFKKQAAADIDKADYPAVEKLWKAQGKKTGAAYSSGGSENSGAALAAALLFAGLVPLFCALAARLNNSRKVCGLILR